MISGVQLRAFGLTGIVAPPDCHALKVRPPPPTSNERGELRHGWQYHTSFPLEYHFRETVTLVHSCAADQAHLWTLSGFGASAMLHGWRTSGEFQVEPHLFRTIVFERLQLHSRCHRRALRVAAAVGTCSACIALRAKGLEDCALALLDQNVRSPGLRRSRSHGEGIGFGTWTRQSLPTMSAPSKCCPACCSRSHGAQHGVRHLQCMSGVVGAQTSATSMWTRMLPVTRCRAWCRLCLMCLWVPTGLSPVWATCPRCSPDVQGPFACVHFSGRLQHSSSIPSSPALLRPKKEPAKTGTRALPFRPSHMSTFFVSVRTGNIDVAGVEHTICARGPPIGFRLAALVQGCVMRAGTLRLPRCECEGATVAMGCSRMQENSLFSLFQSG